MTHHDKARELATKLREDHNSIWQFLMDDAADNITALSERNRVLEEALTFYRDAWKFKTNRRYGGLEWSPKEELLDDCGNTARAALPSTGEKG